MAAVEGALAVGVVGHVDLYGGMSTSTAGRACSSSDRATTGRPPTPRVGPTGGAGWERWTAGDALVHRDIRLDNTTFDAKTGSATLLDWAYAAAGAPPDPV